MMSERTVPSCHHAAHPAAGESAAERHRERGRARERERESRETGRYRLWGLYRSLARAQTLSMSLSL
jgi:hypothetical protein